MLISHVVRLYLVSLQSCGLRFKFYDLWVSLLLLWFGLTFLLLKYFITFLRTEPKKLPFRQGNFSFVWAWSLSSFLILSDILASTTCRWHLSVGVCLTITCGGSNEEGKAVNKRKVSPFLLQHLIGYQTHRHQRLRQKETSGLCGLG